VLINRREATQSYVFTVYSRSIPVIAKAIQPWVVQVSVDERSLLAYVDLTGAQRTQTCQILAGCSVQELAKLGVQDRFIVVRLHPWSLGDDSLEWRVVLAAIQDHLVQDSTTTS